MRKIKSIIATALVCLMMLVNYPGTIFSNTVIAQEINLEKSSDYSLHSHEEYDEHSHEASCDLDNEECDEHSHEASCEDVKIAVFDSGISDIDTAGSVSFVEDKEILSTHGNIIARSLKNMIPNSKLYDVRILNNKNEGTYSSFAKGIDWAIENDIDIISLSVVGFEASSILEKAIKKAEENNILIIAAAGNESSDKPVYPAAYPTVISVGAIDEDSKITQYSNYGEFVDVYAIPLYEGTSYSTQSIVADAVKIIESNPSVSVKEIREQITNGKVKNDTELNGSVDGILYAAATCAHTFNGSYTTTKQPTCTTAGTKEGRCTKCGAVVSTVSIAALGHSYGSWTTTKAATCTTAGSRKRTCSRCSGVDTETISATGHTFNGSYTTTKEATCTTAGTKVGKCTKCSAVVSTVSIDALGHSYGSWTTTKAATCTTAGSKKRTCSRCSGVDTETIAATGHSFSGSYTTTKEATCTTAGTKVGKCTKCGEVLSTVSIAALGHSYGSWTTSTAATCTTAGIRKRTCSRCSSAETEAISATGHTFNGSYTTAKEPTCTMAGTKEGRCTKCSAVVSTVSIDALGHSYGSWTTSTAATCTTAGIRKRTCSRCSGTDTESIPATGHTFNGSYTTSKEATCTTAGTKVGKCTNCGAVVSTVSIAALGHDYSSWTVVQKETCTTAGGKIGTCSRCSEKTSQSIPATGHTFNGSYAVEKEPTCTDEGTKVGRCTKCNAIVSTVSIPSLGNGSHTFNGSYTTTKEPTCTTAGAKEGRCTKCSAVVSTVSIAALGHDYGSWTVVQKETCTTAGGKIGTCSRCSEKTSQSIPPTGHTFNGSYTVEKEPTCTDEGTKVGKCTKCGTVVSTVSIPALGTTGHVFNGSYTTAKEPTCTTAGAKEGKCTKCGAVVSTVSIAALGHDYGSWTVVQKETCTTAGGKIGTCSRCSEKTSQSIPPTGHNFNGSYTVEKEPTCTDEGTKVGRCTKCGTVVSTVSIPSLGLQHVFNGSYTTAKEPTCTTTGTKEGKCTRCGAVVSTVSIAALGHDYGSWTVVQKETCTTAGGRIGTCSRCSAKTSESIPPTGHNFNGSYTVEKEPTCTDEGTKVGRCTKCGTVVSTVSIPSLGLQHVFNGSYTTAKEPTCTTAGTKEGKCTRCGAVVSTVSIPELDHDYSSWTVVQKETCTNPGGRIGTCSRCSAKTSESIPPLQHKFNGSYAVEKEPTCTDEGTKVGRCTNCGKVLSTVSIPSLGKIGHTFNGSYVIAREPTCTEKGIKEGRCTVCKVVVSTVDIPANGGQHLFNGSFTVVKEPTCTQDGKKEGRCLRCAAVISTQNIPAHHKITNSTFKITPAIETINGFNKEGSTIKVSATCSLCGNVDLTNKSVISSSNISVATVSNGRIISGSKAGSATVTASYEGYRAVCNVNVISPNAPKLRHLTIVPGSETITEFNKRGSEARVMAIYDNNAYDVTSSVVFISGNSNIAYVDNEGYIKSGLITEGTTLITASYEGKTATCSVTVDMEGEVETKPLSIGNTTGVKIPDDLPVIGGTELEFSLDFIPATLEFGKEEFKIAVGVESEKTIGEKWREFKNTLDDAKKSINSVKRLRNAMVAFGSKTGKFSVTKEWKPNLEVYGYLEGVMVNGVPKVTNGLISIIVEANYTSETQYMIGPVPVYFEIGGGIKLESICHIKDISSGFGNIKLKSELKITPRFEIGGGIGIANVLTVGGTGEAELEFLIRDDDNYLKITLTGGLNLKVKALFFEAKKSIAKGTWTIYESLPTYNYMALPPPEFDNFDMYNLNEYSLMQRDYINRPSAWNGNGQTQYPMGISAAPDFTNKEVKVLGTNIYPNAQPQLVNYGDGQILVWVSDNKDRTSSNRTMLVYSIYNKESNSWSEPKAVADDGTADFYPQLVADGSNIYVVWQNSNKKFADDVTLEQVANSGEIAVSKFDVQTNTFGTAVQLTENDLLDTLPKIAVQGNKAYITWTSNDESDIFGANGKNSIYYSELEDDNWSSPKVLCEGLNAVPSLSAGFIEDSFTVAYVLDEDNVLETVNDREIYTVRPGSTSTRLTNNNTLDSAPAFSVFNGEHALYWYNEGNISYVNSLEAMPDSIFKGPKAGLKDEFKVLSGNQNELAVIWPSTANGSTEIYSAIYNVEKSEWSEAVKISNIGKEILTPEGVFDTDGNLKIAFNKLTQLADGNEQADLCVIKLTPSYNLSVDSISFDHSKVIPGTQLAIDADVTNNGEIGVDEVVVDIMENGEVINSSSVKVSIKPGETKNVTALMDLPDTITKKTYSIKVTASEDEEYNLSDNTKEFTIGYTDITVQIERYSEGDIEHVTANILNLSHVPSGAVLKVTKGSTDGEVIDTKVIDDVKGIVKYEYQFDKNQICAGKDTEVLFFTVTAAEEELYTSDNSQLIVLNSDNTRISGYVSVDFQYTPEVEAQIKSGFTVKVVGTDISTVTDDDGHFVISGIPEDMKEYTLEISKPGYLKRNVNATGTGNVVVSSADAPTILWAGDMEIDGVQNGAINIMDLMQIAKAFNTMSTDDGYVADKDINRDGAINMADIFIVIKNFNKDSSSY